jgi:hypothetical protein
LINFEKKYDMRFFILVLLFVFSIKTTFCQEITEKQAVHLAQLPLKCLQQEYPNKLNQVLNDGNDLASPKYLHPAFYGCFDWHSAVHGHWSLLYILRIYPEIPSRNIIIQKLQNQLSQSNIIQEIAYFERKNEKSFERTYGWSWLLKLQLELDTHPESFAKELAFNLQPLTNFLIEKYIDFLPKLTYPIRSGIHQNTAFGLNFAWDYAVFSNNEGLQNSIRTNALRLYSNDKHYPVVWEPSGTDFLSPCLEEIAIMMRVLEKKQFDTWLAGFLPSLSLKNFTLATAQVSDRSDGHLVHLDGLNFSRAWHLYALIARYPKKFSHLLPIAEKHFDASFASIVDGNYEGEHWLASFALQVLEQKKKVNKE